MIKVTNLHKSFGKLDVLKGVDVEVKEGEVISIIGPSGSGKSTLLNLLGGLDMPDSGEIWIEDYELTKMSRKERTAYLNSYLGFVFQEYNILKDLTLIENISLPLEIQSVPHKKRKELIQNTLKMVELEGLEKRKVSQLSGGQKQRIAIARAVIKDPKLIIADEPTGNLDSETSTTIFNLFKRLSQDRLIIIVTHDEDSALIYNDIPVIFVKDVAKFNEGEVIKQGQEIAEVGSTRK